MNPKFKPYVGLYDITYIQTDQKQYFVTLLMVLQTSVRIYCAVSVGQNQVQIRNSDIRKPSQLKILDFDGQTPYSKPGQNPDSAVRRRLLQMP